MKRRQHQQSAAGYGPGTVPTPWLLNRVRDAAAFARRSLQRNGDAAVDTVWAIEDQLHTLQPICSAQRVSTGTACGAPAIAIAEIHAIDGCDQIGLSQDGNLVETLCRACLAAVQCAMVTYVGDKRDVAFQCGTSPVCDTCGRPTRYLRSVFAVRPIEPDGLAS
ncbi:phosphoenolpyruvate carboxylase [Mycolicibacterium moriokaense]|nr:phosphoenolpyruvate carboxylase [Mycolicibacterium moriokaense]